jgi:hypothetical protein
MSLGFANFKPHNRDPLPLLHASVLHRAYTETIEMVESYFVRFHQKELLHRRLVVEHNQ